MDTTQGVAVGGDEQTPAEPFQEHLPCSFAYKLVEQCATGLLQASCLLHGRGCWGDLCAQAARGSGQLFQEYIATHRQLLALTEAELRSFHTAINCHICNQPLGGDQVRDHCHIVGSIVVRRIVCVI